MWVLFGVNFGTENEGIRLGGKHRTCRSVS